MRLTIINLSSVVHTEFNNAIHAISSQVSRDFEPEWGGTATLVAVNRKTLPARKVPIDGIHHAIIYVGNSSADPNTGVDDALGYHSATYGNIPFGFIYMDVCKEYGEVWTSTLSHEVLELLADPSAALSVAGPDPKKPNHPVHRDLEVCDPVQGDSYKVQGVEVSNFVTKAYFGLLGGSGSTNFMGLDLEAFGVRPGGYFQYEDGNRTHQVQGAKVDAARRETVREKMKLGRRNARRMNFFPRG